MATITHTGDPVSLFLGGFEHTLPQSARLLRDRELPFNWDSWACWLRATVFAWIAMRATVKARQTSAWSNTEGDADPFRHARAVARDAKANYDALLRSAAASSGLSLHSLDVFVQAAAGCGSWEDARDALRRSEDEAQPK